MRLIISIWMVMVALVGSAIIYGHVFSEPNNLQRLGFDNCNGIPCFMGVTVGMSWAEAKTILSQQKDTLPVVDDSVIIVRVGDVSKGAFADVGVRPDQSATIVEQIDVGIWAETKLHPKLGSFIAHYGEPCQVVLIPIDSFLERKLIQYPQLELTVDGLTPDAQVWWIEISSNNDNCMDVSVSLISNPWAGFRGISYYLTER